MAERSTNNECEKSSPRRRGPQKEGAQVSHRVETTQTISQRPERHSLDESEEDHRNRIVLEGLAADQLLRDKGFQQCYYDTLIGIQDDIVMTEIGEADKRELLYLEAKALQRLTEKLNQARNSLIIQDQEKTQ